MAWIVAGAVAWHRDGLGENDVIRGVTDAWRRSEDVALRFAHHRLGFAPDATVGSQELYDEYRRWCDVEGRPAGSLKEFVKKFLEHDIVAEHAVTSRRTMTGNRWSGVHVSPGHDGYVGTSNNTRYPPAREGNGTPYISVMASPPTGETGGPTCHRCGSPLAADSTCDQPFCDPF